MESQPKDASQGISLEQRAQRTAPRKPYTSPAIIAELPLETRAGSPLNQPLDPANERNEYGL